MTVAQLEIARTKTFENAAGLLADAELLLANQRYARAYSLGVLASEEASTVAKLFSTTVNVLLDRKIDWRRLDKELRSHVAKLRHFDTLAMVHGFRGPDAPEDHVERMTDDRAAKGLDVGKQDGFYVRINEGLTFAPVDRITRERAEEILVMVRATIEFHGALNQLAPPGRTEEWVSRPGVREDLLKTQSGADD